MIFSFLLTRDEHSFNWLCMCFLVGLPNLISPLQLFPLLLDCLLFFFYLLLLFLVPWQHWPTLVYDSLPTELSVPFHKKGNKQVQYNTRIADLRASYRYSNLKFEHLLIPFLYYWYTLYDVNRQPPWTTKIFLYAKTFCNNRY